MKNNIVELDIRGNIEIPKEFRNKLKIREGSALQIAEEGKGLTLRKLADKCILCGSTENIVEKIGKHVCNRCVSELRSKY
jgi:transcriptional pleiotropic regulator of transition state genes